MPNSTVSTTADATTPPIATALAAILPADAACPVRMHRTREGVCAAYSPAQISRPDAWQLLKDLFGAIVDVTPASVLAVAA